METSLQWRYYPCNRLKNTPHALETVDLYRNSIPDKFVNILTKNALREFYRHIKTVLKIWHSKPLYLLLFLLQAWEKTRKENFIIRTYSINHYLPDIRGTFELCNFNLTVTQVLKETAFQFANVHVDETMWLGFLCLLLSWKHLNDDFYGWRTLRWILVLLQTHLYERIS